MKGLTILALVLTSSVMAAPDSFYSFTCATADGKARWEDSYDDSSAYFRYYDSRQDQFKELKFEFDKVNITYKNKRKIRTIRESDACSGSVDTYFSAHATVTPKPEIAKEFKKAFGKFFKDYVICQEHLSGENGECEEEESR